MKKAIQLAAHLVAAGILALAPACKKPPAPEPTREIQSMVVGLWEGATKRGETYSIRFTATEWESRIERGGIEIPNYRGTYTHAGSRVALLITQEADLKTMGWVPQKGNLGPSLVGRLTGGKLTIQALADAELTKKQ
jgi:hypothetical protein